MVDERNKDRTTDTGTVRHACVSFGVNDETGCVIFEKNKKDEITIVDSYTIEPKIITKEQRDLVIAQIAEKYNTINITYEK